MKQKLKIAGLFFLIGAFLALEIFCIVNIHKDVAYLLGSVCSLLVGAIVCKGYHHEYLINFTDDYRVIRKFDITDTKETNVRFYVERKFVDILLKEDIWEIVSHKQDKQEDACEILANIKKGLPIDKFNNEEVMTCK